MTGKKGVETLTLQFIMALIMLSLVMTSILIFVSIRSDSTGYFMEFYSKDVGLLAEVIADAPGDVKLTYDNIKRGYDIDFFFERGRLAVQKNMGYKNPVLNDAEPTEEFFYGVYSRLMVEPIEHKDPWFLVFLKQGDHLALREAAGYIKRCQLKKEALKPEDITITITGGDAQILTGVHETISLAFRERAPKIGPNGNLLIDIQRTPKPGVLEISFGENAYRADSEFFACLLGSQLEVYTDLVSTEQSAADTKQNMNIAVKITENATDSRTLGRAIGRSVAIYAR